MIWTDRWKAIQQLAVEQRASLRAVVGETADPATIAPAFIAQHSSLITHHSLLITHYSLLVTQQLDVFPLPPGDPLLGGARAVFGGTFVAYDAGLPPAALAFSLAHELG